jgi:hypothetical protein
MGPKDLHVRALSRDECLARLSAGGVGRVALTRKALPTIELVSFVVVGPDLILTVGAEQGVLRAMDARVIAFETDDIDPADHSGSSIHVVGVASRVDSDPGRGSTVGRDGSGPDAGDRLRLPIGRVRGCRYRS